MLNLSPWLFVFWVRFFPCLFMYGKLKSSGRSNCTWHNSFHFAWFSPKWCDLFAVDCRGTILNFALEWNVKSRHQKIGLRYSLIRCILRTCFFCGRSSFIKYYTSLYYYIKYYNILYKTTRNNFVWFVCLTTLWLLWITWLSICFGAPNQCDQRTIIFFELAAILKSGSKQM